MPTYAVHTLKFGTVLKDAVCIAAARAWAKQFEGASVTRFGGQPQCDAAHLHCALKTGGAK